MRADSLSASLVFCSIWCAEMRRVMKSCSFPWTVALPLNADGKLQLFNDGTKQIGAS